MVKLARWAVTTALLLLPNVAAAQTWTAARTTPSVNELVAIDATGETGWLYGAEDIAGDGATFMQQEQSTDIRTAYATTDTSLFWARAYVSDPNAAGGNVVLFVFIDADQNNATGGSAAATEINAKFTIDTSAGGYEYVIEVGGNEAVRDVWAWNAGQAIYEPIVNTTNQASAEAGVDFDPIGLFEPQHGYIQAMVDLSLVGLTEACAADLFFRSVIDSGNGDGDLDVGTTAPCHPVDADGDGVIDLLDTPSGCTSDAECPAAGICINGECFIPQHCLSNADCDADEVCDTSSGLCVPVGGGSCSDGADCGDLICVNSSCAPCTAGSNACGPGRVCAPGGRCLDGNLGAGGGGLGLNGGDVVRGGAFTCAVSTGLQRSGSSRPERSAPLWLFALAAMGLACRRQQR